MRHSQSLMHTSRTVASGRTPARTGALRRHLTRPLAGLVLLAALAACDSTSAPEPVPAFDTAVAMADYQSLDHVFASEGWTAFSAMAGRTPSSMGAGARAVSAMRTLATAPSTGGVSGGRTMALALLETLASPEGVSDGADAIVLVSETYRGATFVYDPVSDEYVVDETRAGAPANGVRFVMYAVDGQDRPIATEEIGYADLLDEGTTDGEAAVLRLVAVERGTTMLDYRSEVEGSEGAGRITVSGFVVDDQHRLDFTVGAIGTTVGARTTVDLDFDLRIAARAFSIVGEVRGVEDGLQGEGTVALTVRHGAQSLQVDLDGDGQTIDGTIALNGRTYVTVSGDPNAPTLLGAQGDPITGAELLVVLRVVDTVDDVFDLVEDLLQPVDNLFVLGWLL